MKRFFTAILFFLSVTTYAQKTVTHQSMVWYVYVQNLKINDRFSVQTDIQERHFIHPFKQHQLVMRSTFKTAIKHNWDVGVGFCFFLTNTDPTLDYDLYQPEVRPFLELNNKQHFKRVHLSHRYRLESRFFKNTNGTELADGFSFGNMRFRYQFGIDILLNKPKEEKHALKLRLMDEVHVNFGKNIKFNMFDQNRVYVTLHYAPVKQVGIEIGYLNWFQQRVSGDKFFDRNILRLGIVHNIVLKSKQKTGIPSEQNQH